MLFLIALLVRADTSQLVAVPDAATESLHVTIAGAGTPVVLVPGLFSSAFGYRTLIPQLVAAGYEAVVIEPLGVGGSARPERADYSLTAQADRLSRVIELLRLDRPVVVGHAVGGSIALRLAYRHPTVVRALVLLDGGPAEAAATPGFRRAMAFAPWIRWFGGMRLIRRKIHGAMITGSGDTSWVSDAVVDGYTAGAARDLGATLKAYLAMARAREPEPIRPHLGDIRCPVRLVVGGVPHEGGPKEDEVGLMRTRLPDFAIDTVAGAGHFVYEERPDAVTTIVARLAPPEAGGLARKA